MARIGGDMVEGAYVEASIRRDVGGHIRQVKGQFPNLRWEDTDRPVQKDICSWIGRAFNNDTMMPFMGLRVCEIHTRVRGVGVLHPPPAPPAFF